MYIGGQYGCEWLDGSYGFGESLAIKNVDKGTATSFVILDQIVMCRLWRNVQDLTMSYYFSKECVFVNFHCQFSCLN